MKTFTTLAIVAAMIAGVSVASAQSPPAAQKTVIKGKAAFCRESAPGGVLNCKFASLEACQKDPATKNRQCVANPGPGTTGAK